MNTLTIVIFINSVCFSVTPKPIPVEDIKLFHPIIVEQYPTNLQDTNEVMDGYALKKLGTTWVCDWRKNG